MLIIQANNVHEGGSKALLISFIKNVIENKDVREKIVIFLDNRFDMIQLAEIRNTDIIIINSVSPNIFSRLYSELSISFLTLKHKNTIVLSFGNLPPLFPVFGKSILFFQTVLYFQEFNKFISSYKVKFKISIEKIWIKLRIKQVQNILVQSSNVKSSLVNEYKVDELKVTIMPFTDLIELKRLDNSFIQQEQNEFFYPAIGSSHKNHLTLIDAWVVLANEGIFPTLVVTLDERYSEIIEKLEFANKKFNIKYVNLGHVSRDDVMKQMVKSRALVFPSHCESFGLPLLEARENKIPIIAGELDFVRDLVTPSETFNPLSALSIARALKRFLKFEENAATIHTSKDFVNFILNKN